MAKLRAACKAYLRAHLRPVYTRPPPEWAEYSHSLCNLMDIVEGDFSQFVEDPEEEGLGWGIDNSMWQ